MSKYRLGSRITIDKINAEEISLVDKSLISKMLLHKARFLLCPPHVSRTIKRVSWDGYIVCVPTKFIVKCKEEKQPKYLNIY